MLPAHWQQSEAPCGAGPGPGCAHGFRLALPARGPLGLLGAVPWARSAGPVSWGERGARARGRGCEARASETSPGQLCGRSRRGSAAARAGPLHLKSLLFDCRQRHTSERCGRLKLSQRVSY